MKQVARLLILHKEVGEALEHGTEHRTIPLEEGLARTEDARHQISRHVTTLQLLQEVAPELVLDNDSAVGMNQIQELAALGGSIVRQIADDICPLIVLAHLVSRRTEEGLHDTVLRIILAQRFDQRTTLFELAQTGSMEPDNALTLKGFHLFRQPLGPILAPLLHLFGFTMSEGRCQSNAGKVCARTYIVKEIHLN